jgi:hypothetical protein
MAARRKSGEFTLVVPLDASGLEDFEAGQAVKVVLDAGGDAGAIGSETVKFDAKGRAEATFSLDKPPRSARVIVGPAETSDEDLLGMQTIVVDVPSRALREAEHRIDAIVITPYYWWWWRRWCRRFRIRGRLVCPDGSPVPGAKVCAYDVDFWWWWRAEQEVGCATTDVNGTFEIDFTWCCGWWPWWWWALRLWRVEPFLAERIHGAFGADADVTLPPPTPQPDLQVFEKLLSKGEVAARTSQEIDPSDIEPMRTDLLERLPVKPELEALRLWPWWPWWPWSDCTPDIVFRATQDCGRGEKVILDEGWSDTRWDIPTTLGVTLHASSDACCVHRHPHPECGDENCLTLTRACNDLVSSIGGNLGAPAAPAGYLNPGIAAASGDRPYAGSISVKGVCGEWMDYYEVEISSDGGVNWSALPAAALAGFSLTYYDPGTLTFPNASFPVQSIGGHNVIETVAHWEATNGAKAWTDDTTILFNWITAVASMTPTGPTALFPDGTHQLRVRSWQLVAPNALGNDTVPALCGSTQDNKLVLTIDNRLVGPGSGHPNLPGHHCGGVHVCTTEPDTDFIAVRINGVDQGPCAIVDISAGGTLEIDFLAHDPDGHLSYYTLDAYWGENSTHSLLSVPTASLARVASPPPGYASADQVGASYGRARLGIGVENQPPAAAPIWHGGTIRLTITDLSAAFPDPCAYLLDLWAYKRTVESCNHDYVDSNHSTFTFTVT